MFLLLYMYNLSCLAFVMKAFSAGVSGPCSSGYQSHPTMRSATQAFSSPFVRLCKHVRQTAPRTNRVLHCRVLPMKVLPHKRTIWSCPKRPIKSPFGTQI